MHSHIHLHIYIYTYIHIYILFVSEAFTSNFIFDILPFGDGGQDV